MGYYLPDTLGNAHTLTDTFCVILDTYDYNAFGDLYAQTGMSINPYLYTGQRWDIHAADPPASFGELPPPRYQWRTVHPLSPQQDPNRARLVTLIRLFHNPPFVRGTESTVCCTGFHVRVRNADWPVTVRLAAGAAWFTHDLAPLRLAFYTNCLSRIVHSFLHKEGLGQLFFV